MPGCFRLQPPREIVERNIQPSFPTLDADQNFPRLAGVFDRLLAGVARGTEVLRLLGFSRRWHAAPVKRADVLYSPARSARSRALQWRQPESHRLFRLAPYRPDAEAAKSGRPGCWTRQPRLMRPWQAPACLHQHPTVDVGAGRASLFERKVFARDSTVRPGMRQARRKPQPPTLGKLGGWDHVTLVAPSKEDALDVRTQPTGLVQILPNHGGCVKAAAWLEPFAAMPRAGESPR